MSDATVCVITTNLQETFPKTMTVQLEYFNHLSRYFLLCWHYFSDLLCSKLCWHNRLVPNHDICQALQIVSHFTCLIAMGVQLHCGRNNRLVVLVCQS